uniref:Uncharacterized protein n=1 Tax=Candidatus Kentrum sp. TUN TaxID=2126343 RepID=A0A450ZGS0_9GAMM|nr:MAG: hypothetical protein BECKTUN1418D_GA0071000_101721 [Candidatus Kentron sp. TUN]VFK55245.1 MAG: hypothetical protein BECKTUN1418F_GA0071002_10667 [Candidatus Kentron sp. TUN]VFK55418.1 MAG: hypothetical protein BECKTUN1418E_GA0071001_102912 [Candidatus Kentron sp. TUN]
MQDEFTMKIVWDADKARANIENHRISFEDAQSVLTDPFALTREDSDAVDEQRFVTLGRSNRNRILVVVHTYHDSIIRLISAWKANATQRKRYENRC